MQQNRRKFSRIPFQAEASLLLPDGAQPVDVIDLSLKGAMVRPRGSMYVTVGTNCPLVIRLDQGETNIRMEVTVIRHLTDRYGLACRDIDLDSVTHLRRLVALNLGDEALADREFALLQEALPTGR
ncbi:PilZ domain-containing protein [Dechloromonas sp. HYN0024]|uniref:PilZ domain-containing protein n=1 Tax=Dechloromonas sp. HYN0024 TaxID=2231055 RepID=UPI000E44C4B4|nr:PilZ domain-containing protein [Dechloromonas sp. HYN0024]AXS81232.1 PilZ domain-containing protein [Dechloromonas sp. HYN0024]